MGRNYRFYKKTIWLTGFNYIRNFLAILGIMVILYHSRPTFADVFSALQLYMIEFPFGLIADGIRTILKYTIYGT